MEKKDADGTGQSEEGVNRKIPLRQFQLKASKHLKNLPLILTRYNKPIAIVNAVIEP